MKSLEEKRKESAKMEIVILIVILVLLDVAAIYKSVNTTEPFDSLEWEKRRQWQALRRGVL
jgi:hypothetical protein